MSYRLDITENTLCIQSLYGTYEVSDNGEGFLISVVQGTCTNELDSEGEEYLVESGQEWNVPVKNLTDLNVFIKKCESERLWNYICGPVFRMKAEKDGLLYLKGYTQNFIIGEDGKGLYIDDSQKNHIYIKDLMSISRKLIMEDKWWMRPAEESLDMIRNIRCAATITSGGNLKLEYKNKSLLIGQKEDGSFWVNMTEGLERHILYKEKWNDVIELLLPV